MSLCIREIQDYREDLRVGIGAHCFPLGVGFWWVLGVHLTCSFIALLVAISNRVWYQDTIMLFPIKNEKQKNFALTLKFNFKFFMLNKL